MSCPSAHERTPSVERIMQLLLLLSALLTSLTGAVVGARAADMQRVEAAAGPTQAAIEAIAAPSRQVRASTSVQPPIVLAAFAPGFAIVLPQANGRYERLLE